MPDAICRNSLRPFASQISLRGAMWGIALVAIGLGVLRIRAEIQCELARTLQEMGCEVRYMPAVPWTDRALADRSQTSFHMSHNLTSIKVPEWDLDEVVAIVKHLPSVKEIEVCVGGGCGLSGWGVAERVHREFPGVQVKVTHIVIPVVG